MQGTSTPQLSRRAALVAGLSTLAVAGCQTGPASPAEVEKPHLTVAVVPAVTNLGLFLAQQQGYFAAQGLQVAIRTIVSSTTAIEQQLKGRVDVTAGAYVSYIKAQATSRGAIAWRILTEGSVSQQYSQQILVARGSRVSTLSDLARRRVGVNIVGNIGTLLIDSALASHDISPATVHQIPVSFPAMASALKTGSIDAGWFDEPFLSEAQASIGAQTLYDTGEGATQDFAISGYLATRAWAQKYPETAKAFVRAISQGQLLADSNRSAAERAMTGFIKGVSPEIASLVIADDYPVSSSTSRIQRVADVMHQFGLLARPFDTSVMLT